MNAAIPFEQYRRIGAVHWSTLKEMNRSPLHYKWALENDRKDSPVLMKGRAAHTAILDPDNFLRHYVLCPLKDRRAKGFKDFARLHVGKTILFEKEYQTALNIRDAVRAHPEASRLLMGGEKEKTITWTDPDTGLKCKSRLDYLGRRLGDLKTARSVERRAFANAVVAYQYHGQMAMYRDAVMSTEGRVPDQTFIVAVESLPPHDVAVFILGDEELERGLHIYRSYLQRVKDCTEDNAWPGRYPEVEALTLPAWAYEESDDNEDMEVEVVGA